MNIIDEITDDYKRYRESTFHTERMRLQAKLVDQIPYLLGFIENYKMIQDNRGYD